VRYRKQATVVYGVSPIIRHTTAQGFRRGFVKRRAIRQPWIRRGRNLSIASRGWADQLQGLPGGWSACRTTPISHVAAGGNDDRDRREIALGNVLTGPQLHGPSQPHRYQSLGIDSAYSGLSECLLYNEVEVTMSIQVCLFVVIVVGNLLAKPRARCYTAK
jgi:hypothetical protein